MPKPSLYIETSIVGYLTNRPFKNITLESHRQITHRWWDHRRSRYELFISQVVLDEVSQGDASVITDRLALTAKIPLLALDAAIAATASNLVRVHALPAKALRDALHIAACAHHKIDFLLTWNCTHIANPHILKLVRSYLGSAGLSMPEVATPESLLGATPDAGSNN